MWRKPLTYRQKFKDFGELSTTGDKESPVGFIDESVLHRDEAALHGKRLQEFISNNPTWVIEEILPYAYLSLSFINSESYIVYDGSGLIDRNPSLVNQAVNIRNRKQVLPSENSINIPDIDWKGVPSMEIY